MSMIGHNRGPSMEAGQGFRRIAWQKARAELMPKLPLEVIRLRVARARELGLPYKTYASIRAASGRDVVAFLFSETALDLRVQQRVIPTVRAERLAGLPAKRLAGVCAPRVPETVLRHNAAVLDAAGRAPGLASLWRDGRADLRKLVRSQALPLEGVVVVAATEIEREWSDIAGLAGAISADIVFSNG